VARVAIDKGVDTIIGISTDKAAPPVGNIYGLSKAMMERMFCTMDNPTGTRLACVRFGNIAWSTGSVFTIWKRMMEQDGVISSTGPHMRRYFFTVNEATELIIKAMNNIDILGGKVFSQKMKSAQIEDILNVWSTHYGTKWEKIKTRCGDKIDEHIIGSAELENTVVKNIDGIPHLIISFSEKFEHHVIETVSTKNADRLTEKEILNLITNEPKV